MKRLVQLSLLVNVILLGVVWRQETRARVPARESRIAVGPTNSAAIARPTRSKPQTPVRIATAWDALESKDLNDFIARLRAVGCPEQTIRDIVTFRVCREYRDRLLALETQRQVAQDITRSGSWRAGREFTRRQRELRNEMFYALESSLGQPWHSLAEALTGFPMGNDHLDSFPAETRKRLRDVEARYQELKSDLEMRRITGGLDPEEAGRIGELDRQKQTELAQILSPQELKEYLYRSSEAADYVRQNLPAAKSEAEFRAMVDAALQFGMTNLRDRSLGRGGIPDTADPEAERQQREQRKAAFDAELKRILGEQRVSEQQTEATALAEVEKRREEQRRTEQEQAQLTAMAASAGVSAEDATRFFNRLKELEPALRPKFEEMERSLTGTPEEKGNQMKAAIKAEMERIARETIGEKGPALIERMLQQNH